VSGLGADAEVADGIRMGRGTGLAERGIKSLDQRPIELGHGTIVIGGD
jgi:hypothetical protein